MTRGVESAINNIFNQVVVPTMSDSFIDYFMQRCKLTITQGFDRSKVLKIGASKCLKPDNLVYFGMMALEKEGLVSP